MSNIGPMFKNELKRNRKKVFLFDMHDLKELKSRKIEDSLDKEFGEYAWVEYGRNCRKKK